MHTTYLKTNLFEHTSFKQLMANIYKTISLLHKLSVSGFSEKQENP